MLLLSHIYPDKGSVSAMGMLMGYTISQLLKARVSKSVLVWLTEQFCPLPCPLADTCRWTTCTGEKEKTHQESFKFPPQPFSSTWKYAASTNTPLNIATPPPTGGSQWLSSQRAAHSNMCGGITAEIQPWCCMFEPQLDLDSAASR